MAVTFGYAGVDVEFLVEGACLLPESRVVFDQGEAAEGVGEVEFVGFGVLAVEVEGFADVGFGGFELDVSEMAESVGEQQRGVF